MSNISEPGPGGVSSNFIDQLQGLATFLHFVFNKFRLYMLFSVLDYRLF